jgi:putative addiction module component (TIGR02574 family)
MKQEIIYYLKSLSSAEKIELVQDLWDSIGDDQYELTDEQKSELDRRLKDFNENPNTGIPWEEVKKNLLMKL